MRIHGNSNKTDVNTWARALLGTSHTTRNHCNERVNMSLLRNPMTRMLPAKATGLVGALLASVFIGGPSTAMEQLPFNDGLYAADTRFCLLSDDQAGEAYSGWIGVWTRSISKSTYTNNFELLCGIQKVSRTGQRVKAVAECSGEGDDSRTILEFKAVSRNSFVIDGKRFDRCGSDASIDTQIPNNKLNWSSWR